MSTRIHPMFILLVGLLGACKNDQHCPGNLNDDCRLGDAPTPCSSSEQCDDPTPACDTGTMTCVQCTPAEAGACTGTAPVCSTDNQCRGCSTHGECPDSDVCLPDGSCADAAQVAYVEPAPGGTDNTSCTRGMPCTVITKAVATARPFVKLKGTTNEQVTLNNRNVTLLADPEAKLTDTSNGVLLQVQGTSQVAIYDLEISGASGAGAGLGISIPAGATGAVMLVRVKVSGNQAGGISASGGTLTVAQSTVLLNPGGGVSITNAQFDITNTIIARNGGAGSSYGGLFLSQTSNGTRRFEFNTVAQNQATTGNTAGVLCAAIGTPLVLTNSIVYDNGAGLQVEGGNCSWTYSDIGPTTASGTGNLNAPPLFVNAMQSNFHLQPGSPVKDAADPAASLAIDIDGDPRPQGDRRDMGADEIR